MPARAETPDSPLLADLPRLAAAAAADAAALVAAARARLAGRLVVGGRLSAAALEAEQSAAHALAWMATYAEALRELAAWGGRLDTEGRLGEMEALILQIGCGEYLAQLAGGIPMSQVEIARPADVGLATTDLAPFCSPAVEALVAGGNSDAARTRLVELMLAAEGRASFGATGLDDDDEMIRDQFRRFAEERVVPFAHEWHLRDELIPIEIIDEMGALGVFGLTIPEEFGGAGMSKTAMCVVSEELSRGYIGIGSLGTRSEIAADLILGGGTEAQKAEWLPRIASAEVLPTAVFTEPNTGSDLGSLRTRAARDGDDYVVTGNKTWITHAARADVMTMLVRTDPATTDHTGLSMLLAPKPRGSEADPFPAPGMTGGEIAVLGYRGMKEYELGFDGFRVPAANRLGGVEGQGFKQLMRTFESARIQTAARAIGVAQCALELGLRYARDRQQFGKPIV
ncbi:MAG TPA: acyl-CoA dehydrogenase family protein, partial [Amaricoccus sp.]|nr:acyl-CoA dehydrogenase family protein [Amaricoccus sp.]